MTYGNHDLTLGEASVNLTTLYDIMTEMSQKLETVTKELEETKKKLKLGNIYKNIPKIL